MFDLHQDSVRIQKKGKGVVRVSTMPTTTVYYCIFTRSIVFNILMDEYL